MLEDDWSGLTDEEILDKLFDNKELLELFLSGKERKTLHNVDPISYETIAKNKNKNINVIYYIRNSAFSKIRKDLTRRKIVQQSKRGFTW